MKFKIDENLPVEIKDFLAASGHDAHTVIEERLVGSQDPEIYQAAQREGRPAGSVLHPAIYSIRSAAIAAITRSLSI